MSKKKKSRITAAKRRNRRKQKANSGSLGRPIVLGSAGSPKVTVVKNAQQPGVQIEYKSGDTVAMILAKGGFAIEDGQTAVLGRRRVIDPAKTPVKPGDVIVLAGMPSNG